MNPLPQVFLVWSNEHAAYWCPNEEGYTRDANKAGRYDLEKASQICNTASYGSIGTPNETMLPLGSIPRTKPEGRA